MEWRSQESPNRWNRDHLLSIERKILKTEREIEQDADQELLASQYTAKAARELLEEQRKTNQLLETLVIVEQSNNDLLIAIVQELQPSRNLTGFNEILETTMVPLAAGQTATFATTPIPAGSTPVAANIVWSSSDTVNAPTSPNTADTSGLSILVTFPLTVVAGLVFSLTVSYTNTDGTIATQTNSFTTVAPASPDITGFNPILQTA